MTTNIMEAYMDNTPSTIIIAKDIVKSVIENDEKCIEFIFTHVEESEVVIPFSCILWGLEMADYTSAKGIHALAKLMSISEITVMCNDFTDSEDLPQIKLTPDVLLSCLLGIVKSDTIAKIATQGTVTTCDAILVSALLCVIEDDELCTKNLAEALSLVRFEIYPEKWPAELSEETISTIRSKSLNAKSH